MSEVIEQQGEVQSAVDTTTVADTQVNDEPQLPSDQPVKQDLSTLTDGLEDIVKDGMIGGKFKTVADMMASYQELEGKYANARRELTGGEQEQQEQQQTVQKQQEVINDLLPQFIENGMQLTDEILAKATEAGIDERDVKLKAYELREATSKAYSVVGGKENYDAMLAWGKETLSPAQKVEFDRGLNSNMSEFAIKGLYAEFEKAKADGTYSRLQGNPAAQSAKGYNSRQELYRDKTVAEQAKRRGDNTLWEKYQAKLNLTPNEVLGI
jgi:hypothetical protein